MPSAADPIADLCFEAEVIHWRGPSPYFFVVAPPAAAEEIGRVARAVSYGWGMVPVAARIGAVAFTTALFAKDGTYYLPLKDAVRREADVTAGDRVAVQLRITPRDR